MSVVAVLRRHAALSYFVLAFTVSWLGALAVAAPRLLRHEAFSKEAGILMFPVMLLGPPVAGIGLSRVLDGPAGVRDLFSRMRRVMVSPRWYAAILIPPVVLFAVLTALKTFVSPAFRPGFFLFGVFFGVPAGFFEEIGWMGFAFPKLSLTRNPLGAAALLGVVWGCWHLPVIDYLGAASPHGRYLIPFFLSFTAAMTAIRVLIAWIYSNTGSIVLCQLFHASSTGALVILSPAVGAAQEAVWYLAYAAVLWSLVLGVVAVRGTRLTAGRAGEKAGQER